jgi:hypothetical protein
MRRWLGVPALCLLVLASASCGSSGTPSSSPASWPSQPTSGTAVIHVSGDIDAEDEWRVRASPLPDPVPEGAVLTWLPGGTGQSASGVLAIGATNPFVGEELTKDAEGDRVVLFLAIPGHGLFVAGNGDCRILEKIPAGRRACAPSERSSCEASAGGIREAPAPMIGSIASTTIGWERRRCGKRKPCSCGDQAATTKAPP